MSGKDPAACYRDALDLGVLTLSHGDRIPEDAVSKAQSAYGNDVWRDARWVVRHLADRPDELLRATAALSMDPFVAHAAIDAVGRACAKRGA